MGLVLWSRPHPYRTPAAQEVELLDLSRPRVGALLDAEPGAPSCANGKAYWGIGMQYNLEDLVINVPGSYPAFQAGIRIGDVVANPGMKPDPAGYETVEFRRHGRLHRTRVKARWICLR